MKELLARIREMLAEMVVDSDAFTLDLRLQDLRDQGGAAPARRRRLGAFFECTDGGATCLDRRADRALGDVVARADLGVGGQSGESAASGRLATGPLGENQLLRIFRQRQTIEHGLQTGAVSIGVADEPGAEQTRAVLAHHELFVEILSAVHKRVGTSPRGGGVRVTYGSHVDTE